MRAIVNRILFIALSLIIPAATARGTEPTVQCWAEAIGGADTKAVRREASFSTGGLEGTVRTWSRAVGGYRVETAIPAVGFRNVQVFDGSKAWRADGTTRAHEVTEVELAGLLTDSLFESLRAPDAAVAGDAPNTFVVTPKGGTSVIVTVDPRTCLPKTYARKTPNGMATATIEAWTTVSGVRLPATLRQSAGDAKFDVVVRYTSTILDESFPESLFARPTASNTVRLPNGAPFIELPFELTQHHVYIRPDLGGKPSSFVLDTGAEATVVDAQYAKAAGLTGTGNIAARGNGEQTVSAKAIAKPPLTLAGLALPIEVMYAVPLRPLWPREGRAMEGVLGHDVLSRFVVEVDYAASTVRLHDPERFAAPEGAVSLPMTYEGNVPAVRVSFELPGGRRVDGRMIVDTGNSGGLDLYGPFVEANNIRASLERTVAGAGGMGVGGISAQDLSRIAAFHIGPFTLRAPIVSISRDVKGSAAHPELAGNLGGRVLRRFRVFFDYARDRLILQPNESLNTPFEYDMSGLALVAEGASFDRVVVRRVLPDGAAVDTGLREGDQIASVNGEAVGLHRLRELFLQPGATFELSVLRGAETVSVKLTTRRLL